jgi:hypothetical protein
MSTSAPAFGAACGKAELEGAAFNAANAAESAGGAIEAAACEYATLAPKITITAANKIPLRCFLILFPPQFSIRANISIQFASVTIPAFSKTHFAGL